MEMDTEVAVTASELSLHPDVIDGVELPQPEAEFHTDSGDDPGDDSDDDGQLVSHLYPFMCQIDRTVLWLLLPPPFWNRNHVVIFSESMKSE